VFLVAGCSQDGGPRESEYKAETAKTEQKASDNLQHLLPPANVPVAPIVNVYTAKHAGDESHCAGPKNWKEWGSFAWCRSVEWSDPERIIAAWTVVLGVATGILGIATVKLWYATDRLVEGAERVAERQLRAYVSVKTFGKAAMVDTPTNKNIHAWEFSLIWQNTGATPTRDMLTHISIYYEPVDLPAGFRFPDTWIIGRKQIYAPTSLGPSGTSIDGVVQFSVAQLQAVRSGKMALYMYGWADYNDVFPKTPRHRTEFCARVLLPGDPSLEGDGNITFDVHEKHNGADEECMRKPTSSVTRERIEPLPK
jgi:hypothetical protein